MFLEISQNSQENTCESCEISKNTFFYRTPPNDCLWCEQTCQIFVSFGKIVFKEFFPKVSTIFKWNFARQIYQMTKFWLYKFWLFSHFNYIRNFTKLVLKKFFANVSWRRYSSMKCFVCTAKRPLRNIFASDFFTFFTNQSKQKFQN